MTEPVLLVENLKKYFEIGKRQILKAVDDVSFTVARGEVLGIVGESGCGKTTRVTVARLYKPTSGKIVFDSEDTTNKSDAELLGFRKSPDDWTLCFLIQG